MAEPLFTRCWCVVCDASVLAIPSQWERAKCSACGRVAFDASSTATAPWHPTLALVTPPTAPPTAPPSRVASAYRVLVPARPAVAGETPGGARQLAAAVAVVPDRRVSLTYALAEELGALIHSCALRVDNDAGRRLGHVVWRNSQAGAGVWWPSSRKVTLGEFAALATGALYTPPPPAQAAPTAPCPRCGREVRWTIAGEPYRHQRATARGEGGQTMKETCR